MLSGEIVGISAYYSCSVVTSAKCCSSVHSYPCIRTMKCLILLLSLCTMVQPAERQCPSSTECLLYQQCPDFLQQRERLQTLTRGTDQHTSLWATLKSQVCNDEPRKVCCDIGTEISGSIGSTEPHEYPFMVRLNIQVSHYTLRVRCFGKLCVL